VSAASLLALAASVAITGALHEDGLADMADGCGGATRENKLAIMRDSRIGSYGVLALILSALARWTALDAIASASTSAAIVLALIAAHTASRAVLPAFMAYVPVARTDGLSAGFGTVPQQAAVIALGLGFLALIPLGLGFAIFTAALLLANFFLMDWFCRRQIGGQTGDVLGALQQTSEIAVFFILAGFLK
jgi:adenosylcobinamide-GDP ribazoletransferase